ASGQRVNQPSDDPTATGTLLRLSAETAQNEQAGRTADTAKSRLSAADSALGSVDDLLQRARQLGVQSQSSALSGSDRQAIAAALDSLDAGMAAVNQVRATLGARINGIDALHANADNTVVALQAQHSILGDTDIAGAAVQLNAAQVAYQASLGAAARALQT